MVIEPTTAFSFATLATLATLLLLLLLLLLQVFEYLEHRPAVILGVVQPHHLAVLIRGHRNQRLLGVTRFDSCVDPVVTRLVSQVWVYGVQLGVYLQVPACLVHVLVDDDEPSALVSELEHKLGVVPLVSAVSTCSRHVCRYLSLAHHHDAA